MVSAPSESVIAVLSLSSYKFNNNYLVQEFSWADHTGRVQLLRVKQPSLLAKNKFDSMGPKARSEATVLFRSPENPTIGWISYSKMAKYVEALYTLLVFDLKNEGKKQWLVGITQSKPALKLLQQLKIPFVVLEEPLNKTLPSGVTPILQQCNNHPLGFRPEKVCALAHCLQMAKIYPWFSMENVYKSNLFKCNEVSSVQPAKEHKDETNAYNDWNMDANSEQDIESTILSEIV